MNINDYIKKNWSKLPKSSFNDKEVVIFKEIRNDDHGYGHHHYEGFGADASGAVFWCYSSGCSCNGSAETQERLKAASKKKDIKVFEVKEGINLNISHKDVEFSKLQVSFSDY